MKRSIECFMLNPTDQGEISLRRYSSNSKCGTLYCHDASVIIGQDIFISEYLGECINPQLDHNDKRWPNQCNKCNYQFTDNDKWQHRWCRLYERSDTKELTTTHNAPVGAMWYADWLPFKGEDGKSLMVKLPGGYEWCIDSVANNCTKPNDNKHKCWPRRGTPPLVTVNKSFGQTCSAGGGSIIVPGFHGFLRNGRLEEC